MSPLSLLLNVFWILFGGLWMASWLGDRRAHHGRDDHRHSLGTGRFQYRRLYSAALRIQGGVACHHSGAGDVGTGPLGLIGNLVWLVLAGWWLALAHVVTALLLAVTIIGIPFAWAHLKLAGSRSGRSARPSCRSRARCLRCGTASDTEKYAF